MIIKPKGTFYLIPIGILAITIALVGYFFYIGVMEPLTDVKEIEINQSFEYELSESSFISLFIDDEDMNEYTIEALDGYYVLTYETNSDTHNVQIEIIKSDEMNPNAGYNLEVFDKSTAYTYENYLNYADINIEEAGTYIITISTYSSIPATFAYSVADFDTDIINVIYSFVIGFVGFGLAFIIFIIILMKRGKSKKAAYNEQYEQFPQQQQSSSSDYDF